MDYNPMYVEPPKITIPNIPNVGAMLQNYCEDTSKHISSINDELVEINNKVTALEEENKSLREEVKKLQKESGFGIAGLVVAILGVLLPIVFKFI